MFLKLVFVVVFVVVVVVVIIFVILNFKLHYYKLNTWRLEPPNLNECIFVFVLLTFHARPMCNKQQQQRQQKKKKPSGNQIEGKQGENKKREGRDGTRST